VLAGDAGAAHVHAIAADWHPLAAQQRELPSPHRSATVGAHDAVPREVVELAVLTGVRKLRKHAPHEAGRTWVDITVGLNETLGNPAYPGDYAFGAGVDEAIPFG
jgi:hypothetical protein